MSEKELEKDVGPVDRNIQTEGLKLDGPVRSSHHHKGRKHHGKVHVHVVHHDKKPYHVLGIDLMSNSDIHLFAPPSHHYGLKEHGILRHKKHKMAKA